MFSLSEKKLRSVPLPRMLLARGWVFHFAYNRVPKKRRSAKAVIPNGAVAQTRTTPRRELAACELVTRYGVPAGDPAICHENAKNEDAVRSMAGSTVEYDCTKSL